VLDRELRIAAALLLVGRGAAPAGDSGAPAGDPPERPAGGAPDRDSGAADSGAPLDDPPEPCLLVDGRLPRAAEGPFLGRTAPTRHARAACTAGWHAAAGAAGSTLSVRLDQADDVALWLTATDLQGAALGPATRLAPGAAASVPLDRSGEVLLELQPDPPGSPADPDRAYTVSVSCRSGCDRAYTRYPLVFMHGMAGTDSYLGVLDYWFGLEAAFAETGFAVSTPAVDALAGIDARALQWQAELAALAADGAGRRFNVIAHSQGGLDARLLAHAYDDSRRVASLTTISAPHRGTALADLADGVLDLTPFDGWLVDQALGAMAGLVGLSGSALSDQLRDMTRASMATFNAEVPDRADVAYWSWAGATCRGLDWGCRAARGGEVVDPVFSASFRLLWVVEGENDGVVSVESARWGSFLGELPADHMDEVGQIADLSHPAFDAAAFYVDEAHRLSAAGL
jgi:triacylglycerol esterase/lipase EstA (alpha/beta hydrolase family)